MIKRAKSSGEYHGINLKHGTPNQAAGDFAFEAIVQNNNDRSCFSVNFDKNISFYRKNLDIRHGKQNSKFSF